MCSWVNFIKDRKVQLSHIVKTMDDYAQTQMNIDDYAQAQVNIVNKLKLS